MIARRRCVSNWALKSPAGLLAAYQTNRLRFFGDHVALADARAFVAYLAPLRRAEWVVYAMPSARSAGERPYWPICRAIPTAEFIRRCLIHVLPSGFHRIRHYGLLASGTRADNIAQARRLLDGPAAQIEAGDTNDDDANEPKSLSRPCPCCGARMIIIDTFQRGSSPRYRP
jgi:hypothetical protein